MQLAGVMSSLLELAVRKLPARVVTHSLKRRTLSALRHAIYPGRHICLAPSSACLSTAPQRRSRIISGAKQNQFSPPTFESDWEGSNKDTRTSNIAMAIGAGLVLCAASNGRRGANVCDQRTTTP